MLFWVACNSEIYFYMYAFPLSIKECPCNSSEFGAKGKILKKYQNGS
jgi:hypothetical protein